MVERRSLLLSLGALAALNATNLQAAQTPAAAPDVGAPSAGAGAKPVRQIAMLMYPGFFLQDLVGPYSVMALLLNTRVHLIAPTRDPIVATPGDFAILPTGTFADCPRDLDVLLVPGGAFSTVRAMEDAATIAFVREFGARAKYLTSVCTGSLILGAAGLIKGRKATSHWATRDLVAEFGAIPTPGRVVVDGNVITGGGVTAGIDFGLKVASILDGEDIAQLIQLSMEYDPEPPFNAGSPESAPARIRAIGEKNYQPMRDAMRATAKRLAKGLK